MSEQLNYVVKINTALSNKPFFVRIPDPHTSIDGIITEAILSLKNAGKPLESQQLDQLYKSHQIFNGGKVIQKGDLFSELTKAIQTVQNHTIEMAEIDLVSSHSGGIEILHLKEKPDQTAILWDHIENPKIHLDKGGDYILSFIPHNSIIIHINLNEIVEHEDKMDMRGDPKNNLEEIFVTHFNLLMHQIKNELLQRS